MTIMVYYGGTNPDENFDMVVLVNYAKSNSYVHVKQIHTDHNFRNTNYYTILIINLLC